MRVVWIASYPRSGNTWVRFLLYAYLHGPIRASIDVGRAVPNIHRPVEINPALQAAKPGERLLIKTHGLPDHRHPLLDKTEAFIYVIRHPRDVLLSGINIHKRSAASFNEREYAFAFIKHGGDLLWNRFGFGFWESHAAAWLDSPRWPRVIVRYEDLVRDPRPSLASMATLLGETPDPARLDRAVADASFERMRELEEEDRAKPLAHGLFMKPANAQGGEPPRNFVNKGKSGQSLAHLGPDLDGLFDERFAPALGRFGYAT